MYHDTRQEYNNVMISTHSEAPSSHSAIYYVPGTEMDEKQCLLEQHHAGHDYDDYTKLETGHRPATSNERKRSGEYSKDLSQITGATWMSHLPPSTPMSALTIPGTHDSAAYTYSWPFIATQTLDITAQLNAGIRYFDLRCGLRADTLEMVHGQALLGLRLEQVLADMYAFLETHPSEALIAQIKRDRKDENSTVHFAQAIANLISQTPDHWRTANTTPLLGELRSRIQLFRRFESSPSQHPPLYAYGIDVSRWQDNPTRPFTIANPAANVSLTIQDHYSFPSALSLPSLIARKGGDVSELLDLASRTYNPDPNTPQRQHQWFINFTSAFEFNLYYQITPREIAAGGYWAFRWEDGMNVRLRAYLDSHADDDEDASLSSRKRYGIIAMDFPEAGAKDLVSAVLRSNFEVRRTKVWKEWWKWSTWKKSGQNLLEARKCSSSGWKDWWNAWKWNGWKWKRAACVVQFFAFSFLCFGALAVLSSWFYLSQNLAAAAAASTAAMQVRRCDVRRHESGQNRVYVKLWV